jgi:hypothetical protein
MYIIQPSILIYTYIYNYTYIYIIIHIYIVIYIYAWFWYIENHHVVHHAGMKQNDESPATDAHAMLMGLALGWMVGMPMVSSLQPICFMVKPWYIGFLVIHPMMGAFTIGCESR